MGSGFLLVNWIYKYFAPTALLKGTPLRSAVTGMMLTCILATNNSITGQARRRKSVARPLATQPAPKGPATKYSSFLHSSDKHKGLACNACHKLPTAWTAKRAFPDVA